MQITKQIKPDWDKNEISKHTVYMKNLSFPEVKYFESGKALFKGSIGLSTKLNKEDKDYNYLNIELQVWGEDAENLADILKEDRTSISTKGGVLENASYRTKDGEVKQKLALVNPTEIIIYVEGEEVEEIGF